MEQQFEGLNENQKQDLLRRRQEMLKNMGVKNAGKVMNESIVSTNSANASMAAKLAAIRSGSAKAELNKYISATGKNAPAGAGEFQGIPEPKMRKNPNQTNEEIKPEYKQKLESFDTSGSVNQELASIDALFGGDGPVRGGGGSSQMLTHNPLSQELNLDSVMPSFNPQAALQQKARTQQQQAPSNSPYLKYAGEAPAEQFVEVGSNVQPGFNPAQLQMMMETIAKGIAEKTIRNVLNEYSEQQKGKTFFEYYNKEKQIIKASDGKYYRLTQVELKKK
jgi:hypothetical protein